jgi:hypothetical protein
VEAILLVGCVMLLLGAAIGARMERRERSALPASPPTPRLPPYREADVVSALVEPLAPGPLVRCPRCWATVLVCQGCRAVRTDVVVGAGHCRPDEDKPWKVFVEPSSPYYLNFTHGTSAVQLCSPERRVRMGFLWRRRCMMPEIHFHQKCERCAWRGISVCRPAEPDAV